MATFGLIHGAWHGAWCWARVVAELEALGHGAIAVDLPIDRADATTADYADAAAAAFAGCQPPIVVGHSMAGLVAPLVADLIPVRGLVYLAALLRRPGSSLAEDSAAGLDDDISPPGFGQDLRRDEKGLTYWPSLEAVAPILWPECPAEEASAAFARLRHQKGYWKDRSPQADWPQAPVASVVCADDHAINPVWSRRTTPAWLGVEPIGLPGDHSPHMSRPRALAALLDRLARTTLAG
jgi:hypothetical protein